MIAAATGLLATAGLGFAAAAPASATPTPPCVTVWAAACSTPVVAQSAVGATDLTPADDYALTYVGPNPVTGQAYGDLAVNFNNDLSDGTQDFAWQKVGEVPAHGKGAYDFTGFDNANYKGDFLFEVRYVPGGVDTGLCLTVTSRVRSNGVELGTCTSNVRQVFIVAQHAPGLATLAGPTGDYWYALHAAPSLTGDAEMHDALLDPHPGTDSALAAVGVPLHVAAGTASLDEWSAIG